MKTIDDIKLILYNPENKENRIVGNFLSKKIKTKTFDNENELGVLIEESKGRGLKPKEVLILKKFKGRVFQKCPGSPNVICCNYLLLNTCFDCLYDCTYCFLNSYLNAYGITQFINLDATVNEIKENIDNSTGHVYRIGTGEFTDSLMFDEMTGIAESIITGTANMKNVMIEFKTKSSNVDHLLNIKEKGNTVMAWSLNTDRNIELYEQGTASLDERIKAAVKADKAGYFLAFHFDPVIIYDDFMKEYFAIIDRIFKEVNPDRVVWISIGGFRYSPGFNDIISEKFPWERLTTEEMFPGIDGKYRYIKNKRVEIYKSINERIKKHSKKPFVYLCMESGNVWDSVFGRYYKSSDELFLDLSNHMKENFL